MFERDAAITASPAPANEIFDVEFYKNNNIDLQNAYGNDLKKALKAVQYLVIFALKLVQNLKSLFI